MRAIIAFFFLLVLIPVARAVHADTTDNSFTHRIDSLLDKLNKTADPVQQSKLLYDIGQAYQNINPEIALSYLNRGALLRDTSDHLEEVMFLNEKATSYRLLHEYQKALNLQFQTLRVIDKYGGMNHLHDFVMNNISIVYMKLGQYPQAEKILLNVIANLYKTRQYKKLTMVYSNLGGIAGSTGDFRKCIDYCNKAIEAHEKYSSEDNALELAYINAGDAHRDLGQPKQARIFYTKALQLNNTTEGLADAYEGLGALSLEENDPKAAVGYFLNAEKIAVENKMNHMLPDLYNTLSTAYAKAGNVERSLHYKDLFIEARNETFNEEMAIHTSEMQAKYETEKKDREIASLNKDQEIAESRAEKRNLVIIIFACVLVASLLIGRNIILKQRIRNEHLSVENVTLQKEKIEARYDSLKNKVNPHFLFNSLSTLVSVVHEDPKLAEKFVVRFSQLYRLMLQTEGLSLVTLKEEMKVVENYLFLQKVRFEDSLILELAIAPEAYACQLPPFCVQLVVENAIKHNVINPQKTLRVHIYTTQDTIIIENNLQERFSGVVSTGIGQQNIKDRYKLVSDRNPEFIKTETTYTVKLPLVKAANEVV